MYMFSNLLKATVAADSSQTVPDDGLLCRDKIIFCGKFVCNASAKLNVAETMPALQGKNYTSRKPCLHCRERIIWCGNRACTAGKELYVAEIVPAL